MNNLNFKKKQSKEKIKVHNFFRLLFIYSLDRIPQTNEDFKPLSIP